MKGPLYSKTAAPGNPSVYRCGISENRVNLLVDRSPVTLRRHASLGE
jgi:hypothetical protein